VIGNGGTFTLAPSDANGNAMAAPGAVVGGQSADGLALAGSLAASSSSMPSSGNLLGDGVAGTLSSPTLGSVGGGGTAAVPEPSTVVLCCFGILMAAWLARHRNVRLAGK
jgi:hypothetical protein